MGCNRATYTQALREFNNEGPQELRAKPFVTNLRGLARRECRLRYSMKAIVNELERLA